MFVKIKKLTKINNSNICYLSKNIYYKLNLNKNKKYKINIGNISKYLYIHPKNIDESMMCFPKNIFNYFLLFSNIKLNIWKKNDDLILGPILGVFVNEKYMKRIKDDNPSKTCLRLIWASEFTNCLIYFFSPKDVNFTKKKIRGFIFAPKQNGFRKYLLPLPNIVYDKGTNFKKSNKQLVKDIREQFKSKFNIKFINNKDYLDKWYLYKRLKKYEETKKYLPETKKNIYLKQLDINHSRI